MKPIAEFRTFDSLFRYWQTRHPKDAVPATEKKSRPRKGGTPVRRK
jgi:hypothetical protein